MNDAVQSAKRENDTAIPMAFHPYVVNASAMASDKVKKAIQRCLEVLRERKIYPAHIIQEISSALSESYYNSITL